MPWTGQHPVVEGQLPFIFRQVRGGEGGDLVQHGQDLQVIRRPGPEATPEPDPEPEPEPPPPPEPWSYDRSRIVDAWTSGDRTGLYLLRLRRGEEEASGQRVTGRVLVRDDEQRRVLPPLCRGGSLRDRVLLRGVAREGPGPGIGIVLQGFEGVPQVFLLRHAQDHDLLGADAPRDMIPNRLEEEDP